MFECILIFRFYVINKWRGNEIPPDDEMSFTRDGQSMYMVHTLHNCLTPGKVITTINIM